VAPRKSPLTQPSPFQGKGFTVTALDYLNLFQANPLGLKILADLNIRFYEGQILVPNDPVSTAVNVGHRNVVQHIYDQIAKAQG